MHGFTYHAKKFRCGRGRAQFALDTGTLFTQTRSSEALRRRRVSHFSLRHSEFLDHVTVLAT